MNPCFDQVVISEEHGLHLRVAGVVAKAAQDFDAEISFDFGGRKANAKSVLELLTLGAPSGSVVKLAGYGTDATQAIRAIKSLFRPFSPRPQSTMSKPDSRVELALSGN